MKATRGNVIVDVIQHPSQTEGGILIPENYGGRQRFGRVVAACDRSGLVEGDVVVFDPYQLRAVFGDASGAATPVGKPGDRAVVAIEAVFGVVDDLDRVR